MRRTRLISFSLFLIVCAIVPDDTILGYGISQPGSVARIEERSRHRQGRVRRPVSSLLDAGVAPLRRIVSSLTRCADAYWCYRCISRRHKEAKTWPSTIPTVGTITRTGPTA